MNISTIIFYHHFMPLWKQHKTKFNKQDTHYNCRRIGAEIWTEMREGRILTGLPGNILRDQKLNSTTWRHQKKDFLMQPYIQYPVLY